MEFREAIDKVKFEGFTIKQFSMSPTLRFDKLRVTGICNFKNAPENRLFVTLQLMADLDGARLFYLELESIYGEIDFGTFTTISQSGESIMDPLFMKVLAGLTFSTARGVLYQLINSTAGHRVFLPILKPEELIQPDGFEFELSSSVEPKTVTVTE